MAASWWLLAACLLAGALAAAWPNGAAPRRLSTSPTRLSGVHRGTFGMLRPHSLDLAAARARLGEYAGRPRRTIAVTALLLAVAGLLLSGPVAALLAAAYGTLSVRALLRRAARSRARAARARSLDALCALAADLRAGLPPATVVDPETGGDTRVSGLLDARLGRSPGHQPGTAERRIAELTKAVWRLAERTGAPAAELVERIEADARAADRAHASVAAQAAGAQATALLLAALPLGGIALGYGIGVDPLQILLHTTLGGGCALGAAFLQAVGLLWADHLAAGPAR